MGTKLFNPPPKEFVEDRYLIALFQQDKFEPYLKGLNAYVAKRFMKLIFEMHRDDRGHEFLHIDQYELEDLFNGTVRLEYWNMIAENFHMGLLSGNMRPSPIQRHSLVGPVALSEERYIEAIISSFIMNCLCQGCRLDPFIDRNTGFNEQEREYFDETTHLLRGVLLEAINNPDKVFEERVKREMGGYDNG